MISGAALDITNVERRTPVPEAMTSDDTLDDAIATDPDEHLSWPEPALVRQWWRSEGAQFTLGRRYLLGRPIEEQDLRKGLAGGNTAAASATALQRGNAKVWKSTSKLASEGESGVSGCISLDSYKLV